MYRQYFPYYRRRAHISQYANSDLRYYGDVFSFGLMYRKVGGRVLY
jgi:hypothetical protein